MINYSNFISNMSKEDLKLMQTFACAELEPAYVDRSSMLKIFGFCRARANLRSPSLNVAFWVFRFACLMLPCPCTEGSTYV